MTTSLRLGWTIGFLLIGLGDAEAQNEPHQAFVCTSGTARRVVSVFNQRDVAGAAKPGSCRVDYTKDGRTKMVYSSKTGRAYCASKAAQLVTNLEKGNFLCRAETLEQVDEADPP